MMNLIVDHARIGAMLLFCGLAVVVLMWMYLPGKTKEFNQIARSILETSDEQ